MSQSEVNEMPIPLIESIKADEHFDYLVNLVYETIENNASWDALFEEIRKALDFKTLQVFAIDKKHGTISFNGGAKVPVEAELNYLQKYHFIDPRAAAIISLPPLGWLHDHEILDDAFVANSEFFQDFLLPVNLRYMSACKVIEDDKLSFMITGLRAQEQGPLPKENTKILDRLLPHIARAAKIGINHFIYSSQALVGHAMVNRLSQPVIITNTIGKIIHINRAGQHLLDSTMLIANKNGQLDMPQKPLNAFLRACAEIERQLRLNGGVVESAQEYKSLQIHSASELASSEKLYAFYTALLPEKVMGSFGLRPLIMLMFYHPESTTPVDTNLLVAAFGMTPAECKIATLLAEGYSVIEIAEKLNKKEDTIRKQLQSIYQKTSTNRQPELIKLLLHLPTNPVQPFNDSIQAFLE